MTRGETWTTLKPQGLGENKVYSWALNRAYFISDTGRICRGWPIGHFRHHLLAQTPNDGGYLRVRLRRIADNKLVWRRVHLLVLEAFRGPPPSLKHEGAHLDGDKTNNQLPNLAWKLRVENEADKRAHGTAPRGGRVPFLAKKRVGLIRHLHNFGMSFTKIAEVEGLHRYSVARICRGLRRAGVPQ